MYDLNNTGPTPEDMDTRTVFTKVRIPLAEMYKLVGGKGGSLAGRTFVDCVIEGPCVVGPGNTTQLDHCSLGDTSGDLRNLFLRAAGPSMVGVVPIEGCVFQGCCFIHVGFAGDKEFVERMVAMLSGPGTAP